MAHARRKATRVGRRMSRDRMTSTRGLWGLLRQRTLVHLRRALRWQLDTQHALHAIQNEPDGFLPVGALPHHALQGDAMADGQGANHVCALRAVWNKGEHLFCQISGCHTVFLCCLNSYSAIASLTLATSTAETRLLLGHGSPVR